MTQTLHHTLEKCLLGLWYAEIVFLFKFYEYPTCLFRMKESEDGKFMLGSLFIVEATKEEAESFIRNDPFSIQGIWEKV